MRKVLTARFWEIVFWLFYAIVIIGSGLTIAYWR